MESRLQILQERVNRALIQSEDISSNSKNAYNELKEKTNEQVYQIMTKYQKNVNYLSESVKMLNTSCYDQIKELRERVRSAVKKFEDSKQTNQMSWVNSNPPKRISLRPEIDKLKEKCAQLENQIHKIEIEKGIIKEEKNSITEENEENGKENQESDEKSVNEIDSIAKLYYRVTDDGSVKIAIVLSNNDVFFGN